MQNGSVQRASKRSYMDETTIHALTEDVVRQGKILDTHSESLCYLANRVTNAEQRIVDEQARAASNMNNVKDELYKAMLSACHKLETQLASLEGRVEALETIAQSVAAAQVEPEADAQPEQPTTPAV